MNRRTWMLGSGLIVGRTAFGARFDDEARAIQAVKGRAQAAGIGPLKSRTTRRYLGLSDAEGEFQKRALELCEDLATDYFDHFKKKGFDPALPASRMVVILLKDPAEFAAFLGAPVENAVGGIYDIEANRLVIFDNRARQAAGKLERANSISLFHEATHQLTYNTGLLDREGDVPTAISEGFGVYGEVRRPGGSIKIGDPNRERFPVLKPIGTARGPAWLPVSRLLADDDLFEGKDEDQAYAQAWLLVSHLLKTPARLPQFRDYLKAIKPRRDKMHRLDDARAAFGDLDALDKELKKALAKLF